jgi:cytochrome c peroxidase
MKWPADNPYSEAKAELGRRLFFEPGLARDQRISCAWCHAPSAAFADNHHLPFSGGVEGGETRRNSPTLANLGYSPRLMLDGIAGSLEEQALLPLLNPFEMGSTPESIVSYLSADTLYVAQFAQAFGKGPITLSNVAKALATWQRTLISHESSYDRWAAGDTSALGASARRGAALFLGEQGGCFRCHAPPLFTDGGFHNVGLDVSPSDSGRADVTKLATDIGKFKTPTLRNIAATGPYMHDGRFTSLRQVLEHYNAGGEAHPNRSALVRPLGLTASELDDLAAFLESLTDSAFLSLPPP